MKAAYFLSLYLLLMFGNTVVAQTDTINLNKGKKGISVPLNTPETKPESQEIKTDTSKKANLHSPKKAALYSAILPGLGQIYNRKYWKLPIVYGGGIALGYAVNFNQQNFSRFKGELIKRQQNLGGNDAELAIYTDSDLNEFQSFYRRYRDLSIAGCLLLYAMNIIDASVDAHLFYFNVNDDLSIRWQPQFDMMSQSTLLQFSIRF